MNNDELYQLLKANGFELGNCAVREDGMMLFRVNDTFMFRPDAVDLATGSATLEGILARNAGKVFPNAPNQ